MKIKIKSFLSFSCSSQIQKFKPIHKSRDYKCSFNYEMRCGQREKRKPFCQKI